MSKKAWRAARDEEVRSQLLEHLRDVVQALLRPVGDTSRLYVRPTPSPTQGEDSYEQAQRAALTRTHTRC